MPMNAYAEFLAHLDSLGLFHMDLSLGRVQDFLANWGGGRPSFPVIHVVGTNGKGSVSAFLAEMAMAHGLKVGLYSSPHFVDVRERILVNGAMLSERAMLAAANVALDCSGPGGLTYFELLTALALAAFESESVDLAVMEAGLGGTWDAVNALEARLTVFTPIGMDHEAVLGDTLEKIAADKAGAIKPDGRAITGPQADPATAALRARAWAMRAILGSAPDIVAGFESETGFRLEGVRLGLRGPHQLDNARLALAAWIEFAREQGIPVGPDRCSRGLERAFVPGRYQHALGHPALILDGAHNEHALAALKRALDADGITPDAVIFTCLKDKNLSAMAPMLASLSPGPVLIPGLPDCERASDPRELAQRLAPDLGERVLPVADLDEALRRAATPLGAVGDHGAETVLICGSLYLLAEFYTKHPRHLRSGAAPWTGPDPGGEPPRRSTRPGLPPQISKPKA